MPTHAAGECPAAIRADVIELLARSLRPYPEGPSVAELAEWTGAVPTRRLLACVANSASAIAHALCAEIAGASLPTTTDADIAALVASEFPGRGNVTRTIEFVRAVRELSIDTNGQVTAQELFRAGFGSREAAELMPVANRVLGIMVGAVERRSVPAPARSSAETLREVGTAAVARAALAA